MNLDNSQFISMDKILASPVVFEKKLKVIGLAVSSSKDHADVTGITC